MPKKNKEVEDEIEKKLEYLGLDLDNIPKTLKEYEPLEFRALRSYDEKQYKQYRYVDIKDIEILLSPVDRLAELSEKYKKARPLCEYLDSENEENYLKYTTFLKMLKNMDISEIEKIEKEQLKLNKKIPYKIKFEGNYLWQVYYSETTDKYFMIVPTQDTNYSTFFYLLKKKIENKKTGKIFVPISNVDYSNAILRKPEFDDIGNYLWIFTKDYPLIYELYDKDDELSIQIVGETNVYGKVKTIYKIELKNAREAQEFYKLLKALFILQTELPAYYTFKTDIDENGTLGLFFRGQKIEYKNMIMFIREQYIDGLKRKKETRSNIRMYNRKINKLKELAKSQEVEYLAKEKQITTFLECKKTFFGKFRYYFKYGKKKNKEEENDENVEVEEPQSVRIETEENAEVKREKKKIPIKKVYTLEELISNFKELDELETEMKNLLMDINALKLKTKNLSKKIENATKYIEEIDSHKKSIFEFWKYSNKDEMDTLPEGEMEEVNVVKKIERTFNYEDDFEEFGKKLDQIQRNNLSKEDTDNVFIATTELIDLLNKMKANKSVEEDFEKSLKQLKQELKNSKFLNDEEYDIFGNTIDNDIRLQKINNKRHREVPKDKFQILDINKNTKPMGYKINLQIVLKGINSAMSNIVLPESLPVYMATDNKELDRKQINIFNINPENEVKNIVKKAENKIKLYKVNVKEGTKGLGFTNCIFYDNQNKTLPVGMDLSTKIIINLLKEHLKLINKEKFNVLSFKDDDDDFSEYEVKGVEVLEYDMVNIEDLEKDD